jgi:phytanoyl-CoA hydroxylase
MRAGDNPQENASGPAPGSIVAELEELRRSGFVVVPRFIAPGDLAALNFAARTELAARAAPLELEADLKYPGAPRSHGAAGGETVRRLLDAYARAEIFRRVAISPAIRAWMSACFGEEAMLSRAHHNCLMTKHPRYGSETHWHRDIRYWSFEREDLVSVWLALGEETPENGGLWFVPGSHAMAIDADRFDEAKFFRKDLERNGQILRTAVSPRLAPGDAVFFHCNTLHSAGRNGGDAVKFSLVYSYHGVSNRPKPGTRSAAKSEVALREGA